MRKQPRETQDAKIERQLRALQRRLMADLRERLGNVQNTSREDPTELLDMAASGELDYMSARSAEAGAATLDEIQTALRKLKEGTYGICEGCGSRIKKRRLQVRPFATLCIACKEKQEKLGYVETSSGTISTREGAEVAVDLTGREGEPPEVSLEDVFRELDTEDVEMSEFF